MIAHMSITHSTAGCYQAVVVCHCNKCGLRFNLYDNNGPLAKKLAKVVCPSLQVGQALDCNSVHPRWQFGEDTDFCKACGKDAIDKVLEASE